MRGGRSGSGVIYLRGLNVVCAFPSAVAEAGVGLIGERCLLILRPHSGCLGPLPHRRPSTTRSTPWSNAGPSPTNPGLPHSPPCIYPQLIGRFLVHESSLRLSFFTLRRGPTLEFHLQQLVKMPEFSTAVLDIARRVMQRREATEQASIIRLSRHTTHN